MSFPVYLTEEALQEEAEGFLFFERETEGLGQRFLNEIENTLMQVAQHPTHLLLLMLQKRSGTWH